MITNFLGPFCDPFAAYEPKMPLLTELENHFCTGLQIFRAYGAAGDRRNIPAKTEPQRQRRDIFVETPAQKHIQPQRSGIVRGIISLKAISWERRQA